MPTAPAPPARVEPSDWEHYELWLRVREAGLEYEALGHRIGSHFSVGSHATSSFRLPNKTMAQADVSPRLGEPRSKINGT